MPLVGTGWRQTGKRQREHSGMIQMFCILDLMVVMLIDTQAKIH